MKNHENIAVKIKEPVSLNETMTLKNVDINGQVLGRFGLFTVTQIYENLKDETLEVFYTFPVSATAAVCGFMAKIGDKIIKGVVKEKNEAKEEYQRSLTNGDSAYLMEEESGSIFRISIGRILPKEKVEIEIQYVDTFEILNNRISLRIPTVMAPRYNHALSEAQTYEKETEYRADISINFDKALMLEDITSPSHSIKVENNNVTSKNVKLNKDFVLQVTINNMLSGGYTVKVEENTYAFLQFLPGVPEEKEVKPQNYIFIVDCSGSMDGEKIEKTKAALKKCLTCLGEGDKFQIIRFGSDFDSFSVSGNETGLIAATGENLKHGIDYVSKTEASYGGTEIEAPLMYAIKNFGEKKNIVLLTDGEVDDEDNIAVNIGRVIGKNRLFIFGIDDAVNSSGLKKMAEAGNGKAEFLTVDENLDEKIICQFTRINGVCCGEIKLQTGKNKIVDSLDVSKVQFNNEYFCTVLKLDGEAQDDFTLRADFDGKEYNFTVKKSNLEEIDLPLEKIYAASKIKQLEKYINRNRYSTSESYKKQIVEIAVKYGINSQYTSFLAVNERDEKDFAVPEQEQIALELPSRWQTARMSPVIHGIASKGIMGMFMGHPGGYVTSVHSVSESFSTSFAEMFKAKKSVPSQQSFQRFHDDVVNLALEVIKLLSIDALSLDELAGKLKTDTAKVSEAIEALTSLDIIELNEDNKYLLIINEKDAETLLKD